MIYTTQYGWAGWGGKNTPTLYGTTTHIQTKNKVYYGYSARIDFLKLLIVSDETVSDGREFQ